MLRESVYFTFLFYSLRCDFLFFFFIRKKFPIMMDFRKLINHFAFFYDCIKNVHRKMMIPVCVCDAQHISLTVRGPWLLRAVSKIIESMAVEIILTENSRFYCFHVWWIIRTAIMMIIYCDDYFILIIYFFLIKLTYPRFIFSTLSRVNGRKRIKIRYFFSPLQSWLAISPKSCLMHKNFPS